MLNLVVLAPTDGPSCASLASFAPVRAILTGTAAEAALGFRASGAIEHHVVASTAQSCGALLAAHWIDSEDELLIIERGAPPRADLDELTRNLRMRNLDAGAATRPFREAASCFFRLDRNGGIVEALERAAPGARTAAGIYWFAQGRLFVEAARRMIRKHPNREAPYPVELAFNELVLGQRRLGVLAVDAEV